MKRVISVLVENESGVLSRVAGLVSRRGFNIESLSVAPTQNPTRSRMTIALDVDKVAFEQVCKQLNKLISVHKITDLTNNATAERELCLFKVSCPSEKRSEILGFIKAFDAKIIDAQKDELMLEVSGTPAHLKSVEEVLSSYGIIDMACTGKTAL